MIKLVCFVVFILSVVPSSYCFYEGIYCGKENCYEVLNVNRDSSKSEIVKAYRQLARKNHPDVHKTKEAKEIAQAKFIAIANAYEILRDEDSRKDYDYMLDNPDLFYQHYYRYYRNRVAPKVDVRIVIVITLTVISIFQYWNSWSRYHSAISYLSTVPKYRIKAIDIAKREGLFNTNKKRGRKSKEEIKEEEEKTIKMVLAEKIDIKGGYSKPVVTDILWIQLIMLPYTTALYIYWYVNWVYRFNICKEEYGEEQKHYLIRKHMGCSSAQWAALEDNEKDEYLYQELWIKENFTEWKKKKDEEMQAKLAESAKYKSYRRYMKNHGPGTITFDD